MWLTAFISYSAVEVKTLPWFVEHQQMTDCPKYRMYDIYESPFSWLPPRLASHWKRSWRTWVIITMSISPLWVWSLLSHQAYCIYSRGAGLLPYFERTLRAYMIFLWCEICHTWVGRRLYDMGTLSTLVSSYPWRSPPSITLGSPWDMAASLSWLP